MHAQRLALIKVLWAAHLQEVYSQNIALMTAHAAFSLVCAGPCGAALDAVYASVAIVFDVRRAGIRASEAKSINLSLTTLGMCINARADPAASHVPFRDSKLTRLLQACSCLHLLAQSSLFAVAPETPCMAVCQALGACVTLLGILNTAIQRPKTSLC